MRGWDARSESLRIVEPKATGVCEARLIKRVGPVSVDHDLKISKHRSCACTQNRCTQEQMAHMCDGPSAQERVGAAKLKPRVTREASIAQ